MVNSLTLLRRFSHKLILFLFLVWIFHDIFSHRKQNREHNFNGLLFNASCALCFHSLLRNIFSLSLRFSHHAIRLPSVEYIYKFESFGLLTLNKRKIWTRRLMKVIHCAPATICTIVLLWIVLGQLFWFTVGILKFYVWTECNIPKFKTFSFPKCELHFSHARSLFLSFLVCHLNYKFLWPPANARRSLFYLIISYFSVILPTFSFRNIRAQRLRSSCDWENVNVIISQMIDVTAPFSWALNAQQLEQPF